MRVLVAGLMVWSVAGWSLAATRYDADGVFSARKEYIRWHINRARYGPEREADRLLLTNSTAGGTPGYDVAEDVDASNDFGTTTNEWGAWQVSMQPLAPNARLSLAADRHSEDMARVDTLQHATPSGSPYYALNTDGITRELTEGYTNTLFGYVENVSVGYAASSGSFPASGRSPQSVHEGLFIDDTAASRGHRQAILNVDARELGLGHSQTQEFNRLGSGWYWTSDWDTQDYGRTDNDHFFTGTCFYDANTNRAYDEGEGRGGLEVRLWEGSNEASFYDVSDASGSFSVPIQNLSDSASISVEIVNASGSNVVLTIPTGFSSLGELTLSNGASVALGDYVQPASVRNIGLRDVRLAPSLTTLEVVGNEARVRIHGYGRAAYILEVNDGAFSTPWFPIATNSGVFGDTLMIDPNTVVGETQRFYRVLMELD